MVPPWPGPRMQPDVRDPFRAADASRATAGGRARPARDPLTATAAPGIDEGDIAMIFDRSPVAMALVDASGTIVGANQAYADLLERPLGLSEMETVVAGDHPERQLVALAAALTMEAHARSSRFVAAPPEGDVRGTQRLEEREHLLGVVVRPVQAVDP